MDAEITDALAELRRRFTEQLPLKLEAIRALCQKIVITNWPPAEAEALHHLLHSLVGSAGMFGLNGVSKAARALELQWLAMLEPGQVPDSAAWDDLTAALSQLEHLVRQERTAAAPNLLPPQAATTQGVDQSSHAPLIHLVEDDPLQAEQLSSVLTAQGFRVRVFTDLNGFRAARSGEERPAAVLMDMIFPEGPMAGAKVITELKTEQIDSPPVIFASVRDDMEARLAAYRAGAVCYLPKPVEPHKLVRLLNEVTGRNPQQPYRVLLVDDEPLMLEAQASCLREAGMEVRTVSEPLQSLKAVRSFAPDVLVLDVYMPDVSGPELAAVLREDEANTQLPILFLSAETDVSKQLLALNLGGDDFLVKPVEGSHLVAAVTARARRSRQSQEMMARIRQNLYEREREHLALNAHAIVSISDVTGRITYVNDKFCQTSGYSREELIGQNHRIVKSSHHPPAFYQDMWRTIASGNIWHGTICNQRKGGGHYWVDSTIIPFLNEEGKPYQYVSIRTDVSKLKQLESLAQKNAERLRRSQIFANIGTWDWDIQSGDLFWSERIAPLFGYPVGELATTYENFLHAVHPDDRQQVIDAVAGCVERGEEYNIEHRVVWPDGQVRWVHEKGDVVRNDAGMPLHMLGVIMDIHGRKMAELAQRQSEQKFRNLFEMSPVGIALNDMDGNFLEANQALLDAVGYTLDEMRTLSYWQLTPVVYAEQEQGQLERLRTSGRYGPYEKEYIHKDGHRLPVLLSGMLVQDEMGRRRIWSIVQDMTQRKKTEQDLALFKRIFETTEQGIGVADAQGILIYSNSAHDRIHGYTHEEVVGAPLSKFFSDETMNRVLPAVMAAVEQGRGWKGLVPVVRSDGSEIVTSANVGFVAGEDGRPQYLYNLLSDYTPELQRQEQLAQARDAAERASQAKSEFLSSMSHELRTPMNAILGFAQILECDEALTGEHRDSVHEILKAGRHLLGLINEVLDLAKIESGRIELSLEAVRLADLVQECFSLVRPVAAGREVQISHADVGEFAVRADRTRLKQVLLNLLTNAIKYNRKEGTVKLSVSELDNGYLRICVADTGKGIAPADMANLFQPFNRLSAEASEIEGTGIGLAITRRLSQMMGGDIGVESQLGVGSNFWVELPGDMPLTYNQAVDETGDAVLKTAREVADTEHAILYVEDNPANLKLVSQILSKRANLQLYTAHSPELGIELAMAHQPQLILLDINMPGMDGYQVLEVLKADKRLRATPVIAVTANAMNRDIERGQAAGFVEYITKPINVENFLRVIDRWTGGNEARMPKGG